MMHVPATRQRFVGTNRLSRRGFRGLGDEDTVQVDFPAAADPSINSVEPFYGPPTPTPPIQAGTSPATPAGSGLNYTQVIGTLSQAALNAVNIMKQTMQPGLVPGTSLVYNPASGQFLPASGTQLATTNFASSLSSPIMIGGIVILGVLVVSMMGGGRR